MQMSIDMSFFLQNVQVALANQQQPHAQFLVEYAIKLAGRASSVSPLSLLDVGIGLHRGCVREGNEDCVLALGGTRPDMQEVFGLFVVCDGMGGHVRGQEAARLAIQNLLEYLLPSLLTQGSLDWEALLREGIQQANRAIYVQNQSSLASHHHGPTTPKHHMGTTLTAALLIGGTAYIANVGDSRTYLYAQGLHRVTRDHSIVASLVEQGLITEEERYTHPERNKITRALGAHPSVEVDTYVLPLPPYAVLLLCSDGLWEMIQDRKIEEKLVSPWATASEVANQFVLCANDAGGTDNIGCIVVQLQRHRDISGMETIALDPVITGPSTKILEKSVSG